MSHRPGKHFSLLKDQDGCLHIRWDSASSPPSRLVSSGKIPNQLILDGLVEFAEILTEIQSMPKPPLVILGSGNRLGFGTGFSPKDLIDVREAGGLQELLSRLRKCCLALAGLPCPVIAGISGPCIGAAWELAIWCDYRVVFDSPQTRLGFQGSALDWLPLPETIARTSKIAGMERAFRLAASSQTLTAREALKWDLVDAAPDSGEGLKKALVQFRGKALGAGKRIPRHPTNLVRRFLQSTVWTRGVVQKGIVHWMDRKLPSGFPWLKGLKSLLGQLAKADKITDPLSLENLWLEMANSQPVLDSWKIQLATSEFRKTQPTPSKITRLGIHTLNRETLDLALRAKASGATILILRPSALAAAESSSWIEDLNKKTPESVLMTDSEAELENCDLALFPYCPQPGAAANNQPPIETNPGMIVRTRESSDTPEGVRLFLPLALKISPWVALVGPNRSTHWTGEKLASLGLSVTRTDSGTTCWHQVYSDLWSATLECLALGMDPASLDQAAIQSGWVRGPCQTMQELDKSTLLKWLSIANPSTTDESSSRLKESFHQWRPNPGNQNSERILWVQKNRLEQGKSTGLNKTWQKAAGLNPDPLLNALPVQARHLEGVSRIESRLCHFLSCLDPQNAQEFVLIFWREQLGFSGWKIRKLLRESREDFTGLLEALKLGPI